jgi:hypothetical protein
MSKQYSVNRGHHFEIGFWLIFDNDGGVRMTRGQPSLDRNERGMQMSVNVPHALFKTPLLRASMTIEAPEVGIPPIDLTAAAEALKQSLGCDIDVRVIEPGD